MPNSRQKKPSLPKGHEIRPYDDGDEAALFALWEDCGLTRSWNDPVEDVRLARSCPNAQLFVVTYGPDLLGSIMAGFDGHRGWLYFLAVREDARSRGLGEALVHRAETWLKGHRVPKVQLLVRQTNLAACDFYARVGYHPNSCRIMERWLASRPDAPPVPGSADGLLRFTVTFLEMTERPTMPPPPVPTRSKVALLRAVKPTVAFYRFLYDQVGTAWLWWERRVLDDDSLARIVQDDRVEIYVLYVEGVPAGYAELDCRDAADIQLGYFGLMPEFIGQGLGPYLLYSAIDIAWSQHQPVRLLVNTNSLDHPRALPLYQRFGFRPVRRQDEEVIDPRRNGILPQG